MISIAGKPGRTVTVEGKDYLFFSGFSYLGVTCSDEMRHCLSEGMARYGSIFPSSRIGNVQLAIFEEFEKLLSQNIGLPASLSFSSGYLAAQAAVAYAKTQGKLLYAPHVHPSLQTDGQPAAEKNDWIAGAIRQINEAPDHAYIVVADAVDPLLGKVHDYSWLSSVTKKTTLLLDDSHGIGILGESGEGIIRILPVLENIGYIICYSLSKALGIAGGAISGSAAVISAIKRTPYFTAGTGISPAGAYAYTQLQDLYAQRRKQLTDNIAYFREKPGILSIFNNDRRLPVFFSNADKLYACCLENRILLSSFSYPRENDPLVTRAVISSLHTKADLDKLAQCSKEAASAN